MISVDKKMNEQLARFFSGEASEEERRVILSWRGENRENAAAFLEAKEVWINTEKTKITPGQGVLEDILKTRTLDSLRPSFGWLRYAALIVSVIAVAFWFYGGQDEGEFKLPLAESYRLKDGSTITVHGSSKFEVLEMSKQQRVVSLRGKAYFDVERDETRPFLIQTENATISVLGTSFVIDSETTTTHVLVESGKVAMEASSNTNLPKVYLEGGDRGTWRDGARAISKKRIRDDNYLAWNTGLLVFDEAKLNEVQSVLKDVYDLDLELSGEGLADCRLTAKFDKRPAKEVVEIIAATFDLSASFSGNEATLVGQSCQ